MRGCSASPRRGREGEVPPLLRPDVSLITILIIVIIIIIIIIIISIMICLFDFPPDLMSSARMLVQSYQLGVSQNFTPPKPGRHKPGIQMFCHGKNMSIGLSISTGGSMNIYGATPPL